MNSLEIKKLVSKGYELIEPGPIDYEQYKEWQADCTDAVLSAFGEEKAKTISVVGHNMRNDEITEMNIRLRVETILRRLESL